MKKTLLYRLFRIGAVPGKLRTLLDQEGIIVLDDGMGGWFTAQNVNGPGKRFRGRREGFSGWLAVTKQRVICYTYRRRQINISVKDPRITELYVAVPCEDRLCISFESSVFQQDWKGVMEFRFTTQKARMFHDALVSIGARQGTAPDSLHSCQ